jgi:hypothetical protein
MPRDLPVTLVRSIVVPLLILLAGACAGSGRPGSAPDGGGTIAFAQLRPCQVQSVVDTTGWRRVTSRDARHSYLLPPGAAWDSVLSWGVVAPTPTWSTADGRFQLTEYRRGLVRDELRRTSCQITVDGVPLAVTQADSPPDQIQLLVSASPGSLPDARYALIISSLRPPDRAVLMSAIQGIRWSRP